MKIALTADVHLSSRSKSPERYHALENIFSQLSELDCRTLVIAGDLFDKDLRNHADFDALCTAHSEIEVHVIPGNHDLALSSASLASKNVHVHSTPTLVALDDTEVRFLFLPYVQGKPMGEVLAEFSSLEPLPEPWVLVAHGDWLGGTVARNPMEAGVYMQLTRQDLDKFAPRKVFLGHIHVPYDGEIVHYAGSPFPLDINETGSRRFLLYDTHTDDIDSGRVETSIIYQQEVITILPMEDEAAYVLDSVQERMRGWELAQPDLAKVLLRVTVKGWSKDKPALLGAIKEAFSSVALESEPDLAAVSLAGSDPTRAELAQQLAGLLSNERLLRGPEDPSNEQVLQSALDLIYGG